MIKHLVLSGGGQTFFDYIGIFSVLLENTYFDMNEIKTIYATSSGAIISVMLALKYEWTDIEDYIIRCPWETKLKVGVKQVFQVLENNGIYDEKLFTTIFKPLLSGKGLSVDVTMKELYTYSNIDLHVYTFELNEFHTVDISHNTHPDIKVLDAIRMSSSIPLLIKPICENELCYIDGGVQANYPLHYCLDNEKCDEVEILGFKNSAVNLKKIDNTSNITDYLNVILRRCFKAISATNNNVQISNELLLNTQGVSFEILMDALCDLNERTSLVNNGKDIAQEYILAKGIKNESNNDKN